MKYQDCSTVIITPTKEGMVSVKVVESWMNLRFPLNNKFFRIFVTGQEVGDAYSSTIEMILNHPELSKYKYILTIEADNMPPVDGLLKLYENMDKYDVIGGFYFSKVGEVPMVFGDIKEELNFRPIEGSIEPILPCWGIGMGFTLYKMEIFKDQRLKRPFFKTINTEEEVMTQDLYFFKNLASLGYKVACDTRIKVGHFDGQKIW